MSKWVRSGLIFILLIAAGIIISFLDIPETGIIQADAAGNVTVSITVYAKSTNLPLEGATVILYRDGDSGPVQAASAISGTNGVADLSVPSGITYTGTVSKGIFSESMGSTLDVGQYDLAATVTLDDSTYNLTVNAIGNVNGSTEVVEGATAYLYSIIGGTFTETVTTDVYGAANFTGVPSGIYNCRISAYGLITKQSYEISVPQEAARDVQLEVNSAESTHAFQISVENSEGCIEGAAVSISSSGSVSYSISDSTNNDGNARFTFVPEGTCNYIVSAIGYKTVTGSVYLDADISQQIILQPVYTVRFSIRNSSVCIPGATVTLSNQQFGVNSTLTTNSDGIATFANLIGGTYSYSVSANGYLTESGAITVSTNMKQNITMQNIYNAVFTVNDGSTPLSGAIVTLNGPDTGYNSFLLTNSSGVAGFSNLYSGTYNYSVTATGCTTVTGSVYLSSDLNQNVILQHLYFVHLLVSDGTTAIAGATVGLSNTDLAYSETQTTNSDGVATFNNIKSATYSYTVSAGGYRPSIGSINVTSDISQSITLEHEYSVELSVGDGNECIPEVTVTLSNADLAYSETQTTNSDGIVSFTDLKAGEYNYQISKSGYDSVSGSISVTGDGCNESILLKASQPAPVPIPGGGGAVVIPEPEAPKINITTNVEGKLSNAVLVPGDIQTTDGKTVVNVSKAEMDALAEAAVKNRLEKHENVAVINVVESKGVKSDSFTINMTGEGLSTIINSNADALIFRTSTADLKLKSEALKGITAADEDAVSVDLVKIQHNGRPGVDAALAVRGNRVKNFEGVYSVELLIPYEPKKGENTSALFIEYIHDDGKTEIIHESRYDPKRKCLVFYTSHFSKYGIAYNAVLFDDVPEYHWANGSIIFLASRGIIEGVGDGNFEPDRMILKTEFIELVTKAFSIIDLGDSAPYSYTDVDIDAWYARCVGWSYVNNISNVIAHSDGSLGVDEYITREDMATLINNMTIGTGIYLAEVNDAIDFTDSGDIADYAVDAVKRMSQCGIINGMGDGTFAPKGYCTRAEAATIISNLISMM